MGPLPLVVAVIFVFLEEAEREEVGKRKKKARILRKPTLEDPGALTVR